MSGGVPVALKCGSENGFKAKASELEKCVTKKTKAILLSYPNNPTGAVMYREDLEKLAKVIKKHNLMVISDEIYCELTYNSKHVSIASLEDMKERCIVINGFSKSFAMTGWRVGYFAAPKPVASEMLKLHQYVIMCAPMRPVSLQALTEGFK